MAPNRSDQYKMSKRKGHKLSRARGFETMKYFVFIFVSHNISIIGGGKNLVVG